MTKKEKIEVPQLFLPTLRNQNRRKYKTADTACFSILPKNTATALFGAVLFLHLFYTFFSFFLHLFHKILQNTAGITGIKTGKE